MTRTGIDDFIAVVERLEGYGFVRAVVSEQTGWIGAMGGDEDMEQILIGPSREEADAALLIVRQLIQNNDSISISNISESAREYLTDAAINTIQQIRERLNDELDSYPALGVEGRARTYREILHTYLYGEHAHTSPSKRDNYKDLQKTAISGLFTHYFYGAVRAIVVYSIYIKQVLTDEASYKTV